MKGANIPHGYSEVQRIKMQPEEAAEMVRLYNAARQAHLELDMEAQRLGNKYAQMAAMSTKVFVQLDQDSGEAVIFEEALILRAS